MNEIRDSAELEPPPFVNHTRRFSDFYRDEPEGIQHRWDAGLTMDGISVLYGASGLGKTAFLLHLMICIAAGIDCLGKKTERCVVYYFVGEGAAGIPQRVRAIAEALGLHWADLDDWFFVRMVPTDVSDFETRQQFARELLAHGASAPGLLVFDTTSAHAPVGFNENDTSHATAMLSAYRNLGRDYYGAGVLLVTHTGNANGPAGERIRGSSALFAAADVTIKLSKLGEVTRSLTWEKARDFAPPEPLKFTMKPKFGGLVIEPIDVSQDDDSALTPTDRAVLVALVLHGDGTKRPTGEWELKAKSLGVPHSPFFRSQRKLRAGGYVLADKKDNVLTIKGQQIVDAIESAGESVPRYQTSTTDGSGTAQIGTTTTPFFRKGSGTSANNGKIELVPRSHFGTTSVPGTNSGSLPPIDDGYWSSVAADAQQ